MYPIDPLQTEEIKRTLSVTKSNRCKRCYTDCSAVCSNKDVFTVSRNTYIFKLKERLQNTQNGMSANKN